MVIKVGSAQSQVSKLLCFMYHLSNNRKGIIPLTKIKKKKKENKKLHTFKSCHCLILS